MNCLVHARASDVSRFGLEFCALEGVKLTAITCTDFHQQDAVSWSRNNSAATKRNWIILRDNGPLEHEAIGPKPFEKEQIDGCSDSSPALNWIENIRSNRNQYLSN